MTQRLRASIAALVVLVISVTFALAADQNVPANWQSALLAWRAEQAKHLQEPTGWLTLIGLEWLKPGDNSVGSASGNAVVLGAQASPHLGIVRLNSRTIDLVPAGAAYPNGLLVDGKTPANPQSIASDDTGKASKITIGTLTITVIHRGERYALRIKDSQAPTRTNFHGLKWYTPNPALRVQAKWIPYNPPLKKKIPTILGTEEESVVPGAAEFTLDGKTLRLEPILESPDDKELFFIVRDATSKTETYGAGRFLYTDFPDHGLSQAGQIWLDFNRLENPPCAYTPYATCPLPPPGNRLQVALPAGEQRYHD